MALAPVAMINASHVYSAESPIRRNGRSIELRGVNVIENHFGVEALRMGQEARHQLGALYTLRIGRPVVDVGRRHQLSALGETGHQHRFQVGACGIHRSRVSGRAGTQNKHACVFGGRHGAQLIPSLVQGNYIGTLGLKRSQYKSYGR